MSEQRKELSATLENKCMIIEEIIRIDSYGDHFHREMGRLPAKYCPWCGLKLGKKRKKPIKQKSENVVVGFCYFCMR